MQSRNYYNSVIRIVSFLWLSLLFVSCYNHGQQTPDAWDLTKQQIDSISFSTTHHYSQNYNFVVNASQLPLADALPDMAFDTLYVVRGERIVVADIESRKLSSFTSSFTTVPLPVPAGPDITIRSPSDIICSILLF